MAQKNDNWNGFRDPVSVDNKKVGHMSLTIEGEDKVEQRRFIRHYHSLNRKQKRDLIRAQKVTRREYRKDGIENGTFGKQKNHIGMSDGEFKYELKLSKTLAQFENDVMGNTKVSLQATANYIQRFVREMDDNKD